MFTLPHHSPRNLPFAADHTALLLVDMQRAWLEPQFDPHLHEPDADYFLSRTHTQVVPNQRRLLSAFRGAGQNVLHTLIESLTADGRDRSLDHKLSDMHLPKGSPQAQIIDELTPVENEIVLPKTSSWVFNSTNIDVSCTPANLDRRPCGAKYSGSGGGDSQFHADILRRAMIAGSRRLVRAGQGLRPASDRRAEPAPLEGRR